MICGIYRIRCANGWQYIGQSTDVERRWRAHRAALALGRGCNYKLLRDYRSLGADALTFELVETCAPTALLRREAYWIRQARPQAYNLTSAERIQRTARRYRNRAAG